MKDNLNYECKLFDRDGIFIEEFNFHGDNSQLAADHAKHVLFCHDTAIFIQYRKIGAVRWIQKMNHDKFMKSGIIKSKQQ